MGGNNSSFGITKGFTPNTTPSEVVFFDTADPNVGSPTFDPNTPATTDVLYVSSVDASTWIYNGSTYETYTAPATASTPFYLLGTTIDAGSNKTAGLERYGAIYLDLNQTGVGFAVLNTKNSGASNGILVTRGAGTSGGYGLQVQKGSTNQLRTNHDGSLLINDAYNLPNVDGTAGQVPTTDGAGNVTWQDGGSVSQAQILYVDSEYGTNLPTSGDLSSPFLTPEYALTQINNTGTITGNTNTNTTISGISDADNANLEIGMYLSGTGIPFGTIIVAKGNEGGNANTVTLSKSATATASALTLTWVKIYELRLAGNFIVTSNLFKEGVYINSQTARISWGAFTLFSNTAVLKTPYFILGKGNYYGTASLSYFFSSTGQQNTDFICSVDFGEVFSLATSYLITVTSYVGQFNFIGDYVNASLGRVMIIGTGGYCEVRFSSYGLLEGFKLTTSSCNLVLRGQYHECPSAVNVIYAQGGALVNSNCDLKGSTDTQRWIHVGQLQGTTHTTVNANITSHYATGTLTNGSGQTVVSLGADSQPTLVQNNVNGKLIINGYASTVTCTTGTITNNGYISSNVSNSDRFENNGYILHTSTQSVILNANSSFYNYGNIKSRMSDGGDNWFLQNNGSIEVTTTQHDFNNIGKLVNYGEMIKNAALNYDMININNASCVFENYGKLINNDTNVLYTLISKTSGTIKLMPGTKIEVANAKSPIRCTANTSASKDVYYFNAISNCDGTTYGLTYAFDGSSFAPNDLAGGTLFENVNY